MGGGHNDAGPAEVVAAARLTRRVFAVADRMPLGRHHDELAVAMVQIRQLYQQVLDVALDVDRQLTGRGWWSPRGSQPGAPLQLRGSRTSS